MGKLVSPTGEVLPDSSTLRALGLQDGACITAVVEESQLLIIERFFHELIMDRNRCKGNPSKLTERNFTFPSLKEHLDAHGSEEYFYAVPGMYGGFATTVLNEPTGWKLVCSSWSRICEGSGE